MKYYFSLRFSAIQKAVLRHHRLWSIAGTSDLLAEINEIYLPKLCSKRNGLPVVSGGGKFTAVFENEQDAVSAANQFKKLISTKIPFLEVQYSGPQRGKNLTDAFYPENGPGIIADLSEQKKCFRGYGYTYNPHLKTCDECSEYPAEERWPGEGYICRFCKDSYSRAAISLTEIMNKSENELTSSKLIYKKFASQMNNTTNIQIPRNFANLFPYNEEEVSNRIAVWASDINNMGDKLPLWLKLDDKEIQKIFTDVIKLNVDIVVEALINTFGNSVVPSTSENGEIQSYLPFRIIVAGGDDLCVVMDCKYIIKFALELSKALREYLEENVASNPTHPLNESFLGSLAKKFNMKLQVKPHSFGGSFVVAPLHAPFQKLHWTAERLMKIAKEKTERKGNSVNWRILAAEEQPVSESILPFDKPLLLEPIGENHFELTFKDYYELTKKYSRLSNSQRQRIVSKMIECVEQHKSSYHACSELEKFLKCMPEASRGPESLINKLLLDESLKENGLLSISRLATLFELMELTGDMP